MSDAGIVDIIVNCVQVGGTLATIAIASAALVDSRRAVERSLRPVLSFTWNGGWTLRNVGHGPAMNIRVALREGTDWVCGVLVPPIPVGSEVPIAWASHEDKCDMGAWYTDVDGAPMHVCQSANGPSTLQVGRDAPGAPVNDWIHTSDLGLVAGTLIELRQDVAHHKPEIARRWKIEPMPRRC